MSVSAPIDMEQFRDAVVAWFESATDLNTIWKQQSAPQPEYPYAGLLITSGPSPTAPQWERRTSTNLSRPAGKEVAMENVVPCTFNISCQAYVAIQEGIDPNMDASSYIQKAQGSLSLLSVQAEFRTKNISVVNPGRLQNISALIGDSHVSREGLDIVLGASLSMTEYVGYIKTAHVKSNAELGIDGIFGDV